MRLDCNRRRCCVYWSGRLRGGCLSRPARAGGAGTTLAARMAARLLGAALAGFAGTQFAAGLSALGRAALALRVLAGMASPMATATGPPSRRA